MADDSGALDGLGKIIPSIYYDLIARVCAGVAFVTVLLWDHRSLLGDVTWAKITLLLGAGYIVGLVITPLSLPWGLFQLLVRRMLKMPDWDWHEGPSLSDQITARDKQAGGTLGKMQAESVLCENLFSGFLLLTILNISFPLTLIRLCGNGCRTMIFVLLAICSIHRIVAYVIRENRLYKIYTTESNTGIARELRKEPGGDQEVY
jgi:hypothetical protein